MNSATRSRKLTGKEGDHTVGFYLVEDEVTNLILPGPQGSRTATLEQSSRAVVGRYKHDLGSRFTFGAMYTGREAEGYSNHVVGVDGVMRFTDRDRVQVQLLGAETS